MQKFIYGVVFLMVMSTVNNTWAQGPGVIDPVRPVAVQTHLCSLNTGKTMADLAEAQQGWFAAAEEGAYNGLSFQLTPRYVNGPFDVIWLNYLPYDQLAQSVEWWDENAQGVIADIFEVVSCQATLGVSRLIYANEALPENGRGFVAWNWCTRNEGVSWSALVARHEEQIQSMSDAGVRAAWTWQHPNYGTRTANRLGEFAHLLFYPDWTALSSAQETYATGGWRDLEEYQKDFAQCIGTNIYDSAVMNRPHTPWVE